MILNYYGVHVESNDRIQWKAGKNNTLLVLTTENGLSIYNYKSGDQIFNIKYHIDNSEIKKIKLLEFVNEESYFMCTIKNSMDRSSMLFNTNKNTCDSFEEYEPFVENNREYIMDNLYKISSYLLTGNFFNIVMYKENENIYADFDWEIINTYMPQASAIYRIKACLNTNTICSHEFVKYLYLYH